MFDVAVIVIVMGSDGGVFFTTDDWRKLIQIFRREKQNNIAIPVSRLCNGSA